MPNEFILWSKYTISWTANLHFPGWIFKLATLKFWKTCSKWPKCSSKFLLKIKNIINVNQSNLPVKSFEHFRHKILKTHGRVLQTKLKPCGCEYALVCNKACFFSRGGTQSNLVKAATKANQTEYLSIRICQGIKSFRNCWNRKWNRLSYLVELSLIYSKPIFTIWFLNKDNWGRVRRVRFPNDTIS